MAYKRNPMRCERIASLSRYVMIDALNPAITSATQWFERTLDDSANKRLSIPEGFLAPSAGKYILYGKRKQKNSHTCSQRHGAHIPL